MDKEQGLTDCISFIVMQDMGIIDALTTDDHFRQAGFRASLIESTCGSYDRYGHEQDRCAKGIYTIKLLWQVTLWR